MFKIGDVIDGKYEVVHLCEEQGGMGTVVFVKKKNSPELLALKYCQIPEYFDRFIREVRLMRKYQGNKKVVQIIDENLKHDFPYFVMPKAKGNLFMLEDKLKKDYELQEKIFNRMIDCLGELHLKGDIHRDIKPQNFLVYPGDLIVISDFGLAVEPQSETRMTKTIVRGGTEEFAPPEFFTFGGFKDATFAWDIHSLGKSFYRLLSGKDARFTTSEGFEPSLYYVIERSTRVKEDERYQTHLEMKQGLTVAYDILLKRIDPASKYSSLAEKVTERLKNEGKYSSAEIMELLDSLSVLDRNEKERYLQEFSAKIIRIMSVNDKFSVRLRSFLKSYEEMIEDKNYGFEFAETVADLMSIIFNHNKDDSVKGIALEIAIKAALYMNRFNAMGTCHELIESINEDGLAMRAVDLINKHEGFLLNIEPSNCKHHAIRAVLKRY